jgi:hypothetical protein
MTKLEEILSRKPPTSLYHYSSWHSFLAIVENRNVFATEIHYMNDAREFYHAASIMEHIIDQRFAANPEPLTAHLLQTLKNTVSASTDTHICVFCFSEKGDLLSQWRAYSSNGGCAIGFHPNELQDRIKEQGFYLAPCVYEPTEQEQVMSELLDHVCAAFEVNVSSHTTDEDKFVEQHATEFAQQFVSLAPIIKHVGFHEEAEWRMISQPIAKSQLKFRSDKSMLKPYFEFRLVPKDNTSLRLSEIIVGPTPHRRLAVAAVNMLIHAQGVNCSQGVRPSLIPYESW